MFKKKYPNSLFLKGNKVLGSKQTPVLLAENNVERFLY